MNQQKISKLVRTLYRAYLRSCTHIEKSEKVLWLRNTNSFPMCGEGGYGKNIGEHLKNLFPLTETSVNKIIDPSIGGMFLTSDQLSVIVKNEFRTQTPFTPERLNNSFRVLRMFRDHCHLIRKPCYSSKITDGIKIEICSEHLRTSSSQQTKNNVYVCRTRMENVGQKHVQVIARHFTFYNSIGEVICVIHNSYGVVGKLPVLTPGQTFEYCSRVILQSEKGVMSGGFRMVTLPNTEKGPQAIRLKYSMNDGNENVEYFDAAINPLMLLADETEKELP